VALFIQIAVGMRRFMSSMACRALQYFSKLSHKQHDLKNLQHKMCVLILFTTSSQNTFILIRIQ